MVKETSFCYETDYDYFYCLSFKDEHRSDLRRPVKHAAAVRGAELNHTQSAA